MARYFHRPNMICVHSSPHHLVLSQSRKQQQARHQSINRRCRLAAHRHLCLARPQHFFFRVFRPLLLVNGKYGLRATLFTSSMYVGGVQWRDIASETQTRWPGLRNRRLPEVFVRLVDALSLTGPRSLRAYYSAGLKQEYARDSICASRQRERKGAIIIHYYPTT